MVVIGIDAHKRTHTAVAVDGAGAQLAVLTVKADSAGHLELLRWAERFGPERRFGAEDCRHLTARLERDRNAFARHNGTAPIPVWSGNSDHHRLNRGGNRQLNAALHRIAVTQLRGQGPAPEMVTRLTASGKTKRDAMRVLRRRLSDVVYRCLLEDHRAQIAASGVALAA